MPYSVCHKPNEWSEALITQPLHVPLREDRQSSTITQLICELCASFNKIIYALFYVYVFVWLVPLLQRNLI